MSFEIARLRALPAHDERELIAQQNIDILQLLPLLGLLFGFGVLAFAVWDYWIDPTRVLMTAAVRAGLVLLGSIAYLPTRLPWTSLQRFGFIYWTHASAIVICEFLLKDGFLYGLAGVVACVFSVSVIALRITSFLLILSVPSLLLIVLSAIKLPLFDLINNVMLYFFVVVLASIVMLVIRSFRQKAFLFEKQLLHVSRHDSLTGAYNRGYLTEVAEREVALSKRHNRPLAVAMLDIDFFKRVNDTYGHPVGDEVIKQLVKTCTENLRLIDHFGRIGGEEFVCLMPETTETEAMVCAERLRAAIEAVQMPRPPLPSHRKGSAASASGPLRFTISVGVAVLTRDHANWSALLKDADTALYSAKRDGRNRIALAVSTQR